MHASNVDNGEVDGDSYSGPSFSPSWEKQGNLYTGVGETLVTAHIYATGLFYDCESSPSLFQWIYNYGGRPDSGTPAATARWRDAMTRSDGG